jgi:hypothetical protein
LHSSPDIIRTINTRWDGQSMSHGWGDEEYI